jgi:vacuolar-type H+-ATPase subunit H
VRKAMKPEIEQIVSSDEYARAAVDSARAEADRLVSRAKEDAQSLKSDLERRLAETREKEIAPILASAEREAQEILEQTERYIEELKNKVALRKTEIMKDFISEALGVRITLSA